MLENVRSVSAKIIAFLIVISCASNAQAATKTSEFLRWSSEAQSSFFSTSITSIGFVAALTRPSIADCINGWYTEATREKRHSEILDEMPAYPKYHPSAVVLAYIQKTCGRFKE